MRTASGDRRHALAPSRGIRYLAFKCFGNQVMSRTSGLLLSLNFEAEIIHWRGPAPYLFAPVPDRYADEVRDAARLASYGWGCVPVAARIGDTDFTTSLFPRDGTYLLPVKVAVQRAEAVGLGDSVRVGMCIGTANLG